MKGDTTNNGAVTTGITRGVNLSKADLGVWSLLLSHSDDISHPMHTHTDNHHNT